MLKSTLTLEMKLEHSKALGENITTISLCPAMDLLAVATSKAVVVYRTTTLAMLFTIEGPGAGTIAWSPRGRILAIGYTASPKVRIVRSEDGATLRWLVSGKAVHEPETTGPPTVATMAQGPVPRRTFTGAGDVAHLCWTSVSFNPLLTMSVLQSHEYLPLPPGTSGSSTSLLSSLVEEWRTTKRVSYLTIVTGSTSATVSFILEGLHEIASVGLSTLAAASGQPSLGRVHDYTVSGASSAVALLCSGADSGVDLWCLRFPQLGRQIASDYTLSLTLAFEYSQLAVEGLKKAIAAWSEAVGEAWSSCVPSATVVYDDGESTTPISSLQHFEALKLSLTHSLVMAGTGRTRAISSLFSWMDLEKVAGAGTKILKAHALTVSLLNDAVLYLQWASALLRRLPFTPMDDDVLLAMLNDDLPAEEEGAASKQVVENLGKKVVALENAARRCAYAVSDERDEVSRVLRYCRQGAKKVQLKRTRGSIGPDAQSAALPDPLAALGGAFVVGETPQLLAYLDKLVSCVQTSVQLPRSTAVAPLQENIADPLVHPWDTAKHSVRYRLEPIRIAGDAAATSPDAAACALIPSDNTTVRGPASLAALKYGEGSTETTHFAVSLVNANGELHQYVFDPAMEDIQLALVNSSAVPTVSGAKVVAIAGLQGKGTDDGVFAKHLVLSLPANGDPQLSAVLPDGTIDFGFGENDAGEEIEVEHKLSLEGLSSNKKSAPVATAGKEGPQLTVSEGRGMCSVADGSRFVIIDMDAC